MGRNQWGQGGLGEFRVCLCITSSLPPPFKTNKLAVSVAEDIGMWPPAACVQGLSPWAPMPAMGNPSSCSSDPRIQRAQQGTGMAEGRQPCETKLH